MAEAVARDKRIREEQERASQITVTLDKAKPLEPISSDELQSIFKPGSPIIAATQEMLTAKAMVVNSVTDDRKKRGSAPIAASIQYIGTKSLSNSLSTTTLSDHTQHRHANAFERSILLWNALLTNVTTSPTAKKITQIVKEKAPVAAQAASDIAVYKVAPKVVDSAYWAAKKTATPAFQKWAKRLSPVFVLMAASSANSNLDQAPVPTAAFSSMSTEDAAGTVRIDLDSVPLSHCSENSPMLVEGILSTFKLTDSDTCRRVLQAVPKPSDSFTTYNKNISIKAHDDGSFEFRLLRFEETKQSRANWIAEEKNTSIFGSGKLRQSYLDIYRKERGLDPATAKDDFIFADRYISLQKSIRDGKEATVPQLNSDTLKRAERALSFRENNQINYMAFSPVTAKNYQAIVEGWLISGGDAKEPLPFAFFLSKWFLESGLGNNIHGAVALGLNQFTIATFLTSAKRDAGQLGLSKDRENAVRIWKKNNKNDSRTIHDPEFIVLYKKSAANVNKSATMGAMNTTVKINNIVSDLRNGEICLPDGRKNLQETDGYIGHFLAGNYKKVYQALCHTPDKKMSAIFSANGAIYRGNINLFEETRTKIVGEKTVRYRHQLSVSEFYHKLSHDFGFGTRILQPQVWSGKNRIEPGSLKYTLTDANTLGKEFKIVANETTKDNMLTMETRPNVGWIKDQYKGVGVEAIAQPKAL